MLNYNLLRKIKHKLTNFKEVDILDEYVTTLPSQQNIVDIFKDEWSSKFPDSSDVLTKPGTAKLFEDSRVIWAEEVFGSFSGYEILELGPLEGGHSYMFQDKGAKKIIAIEANKRAFLKCLCVKEIFNLNKVNFFLGDFNSFLNKNNVNYNLIFASGVLYHMVNPIELLYSMSKSTDQIFIWTHYYDSSVINNNIHLSHKFTPLQILEFKGEKYEYSTQSYKGSLGWGGFCGGSEPVSKWLSKKSIIKALNLFGFAEIQIGFDHPDHQNGPAFAICAKKRKITQYF